MIHPGFLLIILSNKEDSCFGSVFVFCCFPLPFFVAFILAISWSTFAYNTQSSWYHPMWKPMLAVAYENLVQNPFIDAILSCRMIITLPWSHASSWAVFRNHPVAIILTSSFDILPINSCCQALPPSLEPSLGLLTPKNRSSWHHFSWPWLAPDWHLCTHLHNLSKIEQILHKFAHICRKLYNFL